MPPPLTEILVHVAAASRAADDARYRALAQAYADFEPARRLDVLGASASASASVEARRQPARSALPTVRAGDCVAGSPFQFAAVSFASVWDNAHSPALPQAGMGPPPSQPTPDNRHCYVSPNDCIPDSQPDNAVQTRRRRLSRPTDRAEMEAPATARREPRSRAASPDLSALPLRPDATADELPDDVCDGPSTRSSPPLGRGDAVPSSAAGPSWDSGNRQPGSYDIDVPSSLPEEAGRVVLRVDGSSSAEPARADTEPTRTHAKRKSPSRSASREDDGPPSSKKMRVSFHAAADSAAADNAAAALRALSQPFPSSSPPTARAPGLPVDQSLQILSPEPPVACDHLDPASLITEKMAKLARDLDLQHRYRPRPPTREDQAHGRAVRPFERGHWRLRTSGWPAPLRQQAWAFLSRYVGGGDAGWSVWCSRDAAPHTWIKLHCFAATAGHTYLILYLASKRRILTTGAVWMDGAGSPTITVPPRKKKQPSGSVDIFANAH